MAVGEARVAEAGADGDRAPALHVLHERDFAQALHDGVVVQTGSRSRRRRFSGSPCAGATGRLKRLDVQLPGRFCAPRSIEPSSSIMPGQPMPMKGASLTSSFFATAIRRLSMPARLSTAPSRSRPLVIGVAPELVFPDIGLGQVFGFLHVEMHDAGADIGAADIDAENGFMRLEHPLRREMHGADQAGFIRIVADRDQIDLDAVGFQDHRRCGRSRARRRGSRGSHRRPRCARCSSSLSA